MKKSILFSKLINPKVILSVMLSIGFHNSYSSHRDVISTYEINQEKSKLSGVVVDLKGAPVIGATVIVDGTTYGTVTDQQGQFYLNAAVGAKLIVSHLSYQTNSIIATADKMSVVLADQAQVMDEIVIVGYGGVKKSDLTSSIATVKSEDIEKTSTGNAMVALQGKVSGVQILNSSGAPGSTPNVIIRGVTTQNGSAPLYVVDGVPGVSMNGINTADIKSIEILKDASATSIYGTRGSNGVVLITTKTGSYNTKLKFNVNIRQGLQYMQKPDLATAEEYILVNTARYENDGLSVPVSFDGNTTDTDWWSECMRTLATTNDYNFSFSGGTEKMTYSGSVGYYSQDAQTKGQGYWRRLTARLNMDYKVNDYIKFGQSFAPRIATTQDYASSISGAMSYDPTTAVYKSAEEQEGLDEFSIYAQSQYTTAWNPVATQARTFGGDNWTNLVSTTFLDITPIESLTFRTLLGYDILYSESDSFSPEFNIGGTEKSDVNTVYASSGHYTDLTWNNTLTYMESFKKHNITAMVGFVLEESNGRTLSASKESVPNSYNEALRYLSAATLNAKASGIESRSALMSILGRALYNYDNRYYLTATFRRDGSSKFTGDNKYASFPSLSAAWALKNEKFLKTNDLISQLKLRLSWGRVGNQNIPSGAFDDKITSNAVVLDNKVTTGSLLTAIGSLDLDWEIVEEYNVGVDLGIGRNFDFTVEFFRKQSNGMLMQASNLLITGLPSSGALMWVNVGSMRSTGIDLSASYRGSAGDLKYNLSANISHSKSIAVDLVDNVPQYNGSFLGLTTHITEPGEEIGLFYLYEADGIFKSQAEVDAHSKNGSLIQPNAQPGDIRFTDVNDDGVIDNNDKIRAGSSLPKFTYGFNASLEYKKFDFNLSITGALGNKIFNSQKQRTDTGYAGVNFTAGLYENSWSESNIDAEIPRLSVNDSNGNFKLPSTYFLEDGDYAKIQNLQVGYNFKINKLDDLKCRVSLSAQNLLTITGYSGADPEVAASSSSVLSSGIDWYSYPQTKTFLIGLDFNF